MGTAALSRARRDSARGRDRTVVNNRLCFAGACLILATAASLGACSSPDSSSIASGAAGGPEEHGARTGTGNQEDNDPSTDAGKRDGGKKPDATSSPSDAGGGPTATGASLISAGLAQTCTSLANGNAKCWGHGWFGNLGNGVAGANSNVPVSVLNVSSVSGLAMGKYFGCAIVGGGKVKCWGDGTNGELGNGMNEMSAVPVDVTGITGATAIAAGWYHACAVVAGGAIKCWGGFDVSGALGSSIAATSNVPIDADYIPTNAVKITAGAQHTCAVFANGSSYCWGLSPFGAVGAGGAAMIDVVEVDSNDSTTCALKNDGRVFCWGINNHGQLGAGASVAPGGGNQQSSYPVEVVGVANATAIAVGAMHVCALVAGGTVQCWGGNSHGQLGRGTDDAAGAPGQVLGISGAVSITSGSRHSCVKFANGTAKCWGSNGGTLGDGTNGSSSNVPVSVVNLP